ncbi:hypothetical protein [Gorillibacterium sp. sgz5001074]|uniref:hypothetical protein n=1 Tax=Gorillibacterium sp. sgz5001074 TaxID=3446695 RepID=UPI003F675EE0
MKLKLIPLLLAVVGSSAILFGGWFAYHSVAMESPLNQALNGTPGVESSEAKIGNKVVFNVKLNPQAQLSEIVHEIEKRAADISGDREVQIHVDSNSSSELEAWWSRALFDVAQAMETSRYASIPVSLEEKAGLVQGLKVESQMDEKNVYVKLTQGEYAKFVILPRTPAKMGVWPNE